MDVLLLFVSVVGLMLIGVPIAVSLGLSSIIFLLVLSDTSLASVAQSFFQAMAGHYTLLAIPFFILASSFMSTGGVARRIIRFSIALVGHMHGGLAIAGVFACMLFAALSGSSPATVVAIGSIVIAGMRQVGYSKDFAAGVIANAGTLGILIPPSITMIIYATFTETSIARLFAAGLLPGILLALCYMGFIVARVLLNPKLAPKSDERASLGDLGRALLDIVPFLLLIVIVLGSIYGGFATPTEAGAVGTIGAIVIAGIYGKLSLKLVTDALSRTVRMSGNILFIVFTSMIFAYATALSGVGEDLVGMLEEANVSRTTFLLIIMVVFAILGCFMEGLGMIAIIVPVIFPALLSLEVDPIWFGVFVVILVELGQLTPPLGVILFVVASSSDKVRVEDVIMGTLPFFIIILAFMLLLIGFPQIALFLPEFTFG